jgi:chromate transporter
MSSPPAPFALTAHLALLSSISFGGFPTRPGWKVWGFPGALASAFATFEHPCAMYLASYRLWDRFPDPPWQRIVRRGLVPVTMGLVIASGMVMPRAADAGWQAAAVTIAAAAITFATRLNPMWLLLAGGALGGLGLL